jgi:hypothetical protein
MVFDRLSTVSFSFCFVIPLGGRSQKSENGNNLTTMNCPNCKKPNRPEAQYCDQCATPLLEVPSQPVSPGKNYEASFFIFWGLTALMMGFILYNLITSFPKRQ